MSGNEQSSSEYKIQYSLGWFGKNYWLVLNTDSFSILDSNKQNGIEIPYKNVYQVILTPLSLTQIEIYCLDNILENYPVETIKWFPPRPTYTPWIHFFQINSLKRKEILEIFKSKGIRTKFDRESFTQYWIDMKNKSDAALKNNL